MEKIEYTKMYRLEDYHFWFLGKRFFIDSILSKYKNRIASVLDLGSGTGGMTKYLQKYGKVKGVEKYDYAIKLAKKRHLDITHGSIEKLKMPSQSFDLVTILDVLYHQDVEDESKVIAEGKRVLKRGGLLLITDSALDFLTSYHDVVTHGKKRYTISEIKKIVEKQNFRMLRASYIYFSIFPIIFIKRLLIGRFQKNSSSDVASVPKILNILLIMLLKTESVILKYTSFPIGSSLIILAEKK